MSTAELLFEGARTPATADRASILRRAVSIARRRYFVTSVAVAGIASTLGLMLGFSWSSKLGIVSLAPWVALIGFDAGVVAGVVGAASATVLWLVASRADGVHLDDLQIGVRTGSLVILAVGSALAGRRLHASERAHRTLTALQSTLIDSTLDGICLTDSDGAIVISNRPLRRLVAELGMPTTGTVPERLLAIADTITEPDCYRGHIASRVSPALGYRAWRRGRRGGGAGGGGQRCPGRGLDRAGRTRGDCWGVPHSVAAA